MAEQLVINMVYYCHNKETWNKKKECTCACVVSVPSPLRALKKSCFLKTKTKNAYDL